MSDHDPHDLDVAFRALERDIAGMSHPRGAGAALRSARRRRTTRAAVAALALAVAGTAAATHHAGQQDIDGGPADGSSAGGMTIESLSAATQGWVSGWRGPKRTDRIPSDLLPQCWLGTLTGRVSTAGILAADRGGDAALVTPTGDEAAIATFSAWNGHPAGASTAGYAAYASALDACTNAHRAHTYAWDDGQGQSWTMTDGTNETVHVWVVRTDLAVGILTTVGSAGAVPDDVDGRVASTIVEALQSPSSYSDEGNGHPDHSVSLDGIATLVNDDDFAAAMKDWDVLREATDASATPGDVGCAGPPAWAAEDAGVSADLGRYGSQQYVPFANDEQATRAFRAIEDSLTGCPDADYKVESLAPDENGATLLVASGPSTIWVTRYRYHVGIITLSQGGVAPPTEDSERLASLVVKAIAAQDR